MGTKKCVAEKEKQKNWQKSEERNNNTQLSFCWKTEAHMWRKIEHKHINVKIVKSKGKNRNKDDQRMKLN